jgi:hypothetical protein
VRSLWTPRAPATTRVCGGAGTLMSARSWEDVLTRLTTFSCIRYSLCFCSIARSGPDKSCQHPHIPNRFQLGDICSQVYIKINRSNLISDLIASTKIHFIWISNIIYFHCTNNSYMTNYVSNGHLQL